MSPGLLSSCRARSEEAIAYLYEALSLIDGLPNTRARLGTDQTCFTLQSDAIGARSRIAAGFEAIHRAFEV